MESDAATMGRCAARMGRRRGRTACVRRLLWLALTLGLLVGAPASSDDTLRIMTYNIYYGGQDHYPAIGRQHEWLRVIENAGADLVVIQEANGWLPSEQNLIAAYLDSLNAGLPPEEQYAGYVAEANSQFNVAFFSRLPVLTFEGYRVVQVQRETCSFRHVFIHAALDAWGERVHVVGTHFRAGWDERIERELEARALLTILDGLPPGEEVWVVGDFNSYSPVDVEPTSPTQPDYSGGAPSPEMYGCEPIAYLLDRGYRDAFRDLHPLEAGYTKETNDFKPWTPGPIFRIDFILDAPGGDWELDACMLIDDAWGESGSDHYAVCADYRRPGGASANEPPAETGGPWARLGPNPLRLPGRLHYALSRPGRVTLEVIACDGRRVVVLADGWRAAGDHGLVWDGRDRAGRPLAEGTYFVRIRGRDGALARPILLVPR